MTIRGVNFQTPSASSNSVPADSNDSSSLALITTVSAAALTVFSGISYFTTKAVRNGDWPKDAETLNACRNSVWSSTILATFTAASTAALVAPLVGLAAGTAVGFAVGSAAAAGVAYRLAPRN